MAKAPPAFQFYPSDFVEGTSHLDAEAIGCYLLLLCFQWAHGFLPSDLSKRARICRKSEAEFAGVWPEIEDKFVESECGGLINERLESVRAKQVALAKKRAEAGRKGGQAIASNMLKQNGKQKQSPLKVEDRSKKKEIKKEDEPRESFGDPTLDAAFADWLKHKSETGKTYKPTGLRNLVSEVRNLAEEHGAPEVARAMRSAISQGYHGFVHQVGNKPRGSPDDKTYTPI